MYNGGIGVTGMKPFSHVLTWCIVNGGCNVVIVYILDLEWLILILDATKK